MQTFKICNKDGKSRSQRLWEIYDLIEERDAPCDLFCYATLAEEFDNTIYSNATRKFPVPLYHGNRYVMVVYVYKSNVILLHPMKNCEKDTIVATFKDIYNYLHKPKFASNLHVLDNECSNILKDFIKNKNTQTYKLSNLNSIKSTLWKGLSKPSKSFYLRPVYRTSKISSTIKVGISPTGQTNSQFTS